MIICMMNMVKENIVIFSHNYIEFGLWLFCIYTLAIHSFNMLNHCSIALFHTLCLSSDKI